MAAARVKKATAELTVASWSRARPATAEPGEGSFHHPVPGLHGEALLAGCAADKGDRDR